MLTPLKKLKTRLKHSLLGAPIDQCNWEIWTPLPDDVYLASYPKSGNTWLRMLVAHLLHPDQRTINPVYSKTLEQATFDKMKKMEVEEKWQPKNTGSKRSTPFMRKGRINQWMDQLSPKVIQQIETA